MIPRLHTIGRRLLGDTSGVAMLEFAYAAPLVLAVGLYGAETANIALTNMRISQVALNLADNASRVGVSASGALNTTQIRELDMNDVLQAARLQGAGIKLTTYGRVTVSSLENVKQAWDTTQVQRIHWQRCIGLKSGTGYDVTDTKFTTNPTDGTTADQANKGKDLPLPAGMGDPGGAAVTAPLDSGVIFVEVNYQYQPIVNLWMSNKRIHYIASFIVRDRRQFTQIFNPDPAVATADKATCDKHTT